MKLYKEKYFDRRTWILENISKLGLTSNEALILLQIDLHNEYNESINIDLLAKISNLSKNEVDNTINSLCIKGYLVITTKDLLVNFNIDNIFIANNIVSDDNDIFATFENEFNRVLTQNEMYTISEWLRLYDQEEIIETLRKASINKSLSFKYIDKVLSDVYDK